MSDLTSFDKLSKKRKKQLNSKRRRTWGAVNPVTRKPPNPKAYDRKKIPPVSEADADNNDE